MAKQGTPVTLRPGITVRGVPLCGAPTVRQGKARYCERQAGHGGRHRSELRGRVTYWTEE